MQSSHPQLEFTDPQWLVPCDGKWHRKELTIKNVAPDKLVICGYNSDDFADDKPFRVTAGLDAFPIAVEGGKTYEFSVEYRPQ